MHYGDLYGGKQPTVLPNRDACEPQQRPAWPDTDSDAIEAPTRSW